MSWRDCATLPGPWDFRAQPVVHAGQIVSLWNRDGTSAVFDPKANRWTTLADPFGQSTDARAGAVKASVGKDFIVWGGAVGERKRRYLTDGARLGSDGRWTALATKGAPSQRSAPIHAWTGRELLIWGGWKDRNHAKGGAAYDPATDTWRKLRARETDARDGVWTGKELWVWDTPDAGRKGHAYNPATDEWRELAALPDKRPWDRAMATCAGGALYVGHEDSTGGDLDGCAVWRYEPLSDVWEPSAPPPRVRGGEPRLVDCDGRIILGIRESLFEYLPAQDAWAKLPDPKTGIDPHLLWLNGELFAFGDKGLRALALPKAGKAEVVEAAPTVISLTSALQVEMGAAVTALAIGAGGVITGYDDGTIRAGDKVVRKADGTRIAGLSADARGWTAIAGDALEGATKAKLGFVGEAMTASGDQIIVAGGGKLASFGSVAKVVSAPGETKQLAIFGDTIVRTGTKIDVHDAKTLKLRETLAFGADAIGVPAEGGTYVAAGGFRAKLVRPGKRRGADSEIRLPYAKRVAVSADGHWLAAIARSGDVELHDVRGDHCAFSYDSKDLSALAVSADGRALAFGAANGAVYEVDIPRLGITRRDASGKNVVLQPPASDVIARVGRQAEVVASPDDGVFVKTEDGRFGEYDFGTGTWAWVTKSRDLAPRTEARRAEPDGKEGPRGWRRWNIYEPDQPARFIELSDGVHKMAVLRNGAVAMCRFHELFVLAANGRDVRTFAGHGTYLDGLCPSPDGGMIIVWDRQGVVRRWRLQ